MIKKLNFLIGILTAFTLISCSSDDNNDHQDQDDAITYYKKSTIIENVKNSLQKKYRKKVVVLRHRPSILPILSSYVHGKEKAEQIATETLPRHGKNKNIISSMLRFSYYLTDYIFGQFVIWFKYTSKGYIVLYDRYYFDFIEDARRSNLSIPKPISRFLYKFVFKPNINIFLYAQPELILSRKQEMTHDDITHLTSGYLSLFQRFEKRFPQKYVALENVDLSITLNTIDNLIVEVS